MEGRTRLFQRNKSVRIPIKKVPEGTSLNGAGNGLLLEPLQLLYNITKNEECQEIIDNLFKLVA